MELLIGESGIEAEEPMTVGQMFQATKNKVPNHPALKYKDNGEWKAITYAEYYDLCVQAAKSFLKVMYTEIIWLHVSIKTASLSLWITLTNLNPNCIFAASTSYINSLSAGIGAPPWCSHHWVQLC